MLGLSQRDREILTQRSKKARKAQLSEASTFYMTGESLLSDGEEYADPRDRKRGVRIKGEEKDLREQYPEIMPEKWARGRGYSASSMRVPPLSFGSQVSMRAVHPSRNDDSYRKRSRSYEDDHRGKRRKVIKESRKGYWQRIPGSTVMADCEREFDLIWIPP